MTNTPCKLSLMSPCEAIIEEDESYLVAFEPLISIQVFFLNKSLTNPAQINLLIGNQQLQAVILQPDQTQTRIYDIANYTGITFTNVADLKRTPVQIRVERKLVDNRPEQAQNYRFESVEVKETAFRTDNA